MNNLHHSSITFTAIHCCQSIFFCTSMSTRPRGRPPKNCSLHGPAAVKMHQTPAVISSLASENNHIFDPPPSPPPGIRPLEPHESLFAALAYSHLNAPTLPSPSGREGLNFLKSIKRHAPLWKEVGIVKTNELPQWFEEQVTLCAHDLSKSTNDKYLVVK